MTQAPLPIAIIGAGPIGLAAAAQFHARGLDAVVLEAGPDIGHAVRAWRLSGVSAYGTKLAI